MSLGFDQQIIGLDAKYVNPFQVERGGVLSLTTLSGISYATYEPNPTAATIPLGIMLHDQEEVDLHRALDPSRSANVHGEFSPVPYMIQGIIITNAIHPDINPATILPGAPAYLAQSGLITTVPTYRRIGSFDSQLNDLTIKIPVRSQSTTLMRVAGNNAIINPDPVLVTTAGWARLRINI